MLKYIFLIFFKKRGLSIIIIIFVCLIFLADTLTNSILIWSASGKIGIERPIHESNFGKMMWETRVYYLLSCHLFPRKKFELWEGLSMRNRVISFQCMAIGTALIILNVFDSVPTRRAACWIFPTWLWHFCSRENNLLGFFTLLLLQLVLLAWMLGL